ncbi:MAG: cob(I)yrinic acid a,c-diamide adenosyltransferase [Caulobacterales bacterium]|nr:cob(I)yrinic acid a,c-diamide adenosyltransferase [Caulobacterales bacterium]
MVVLNRIYTRTGDAGTTRLATGEPVSKAGPRIAANGDVDELNACLGLVRLHTAGDALDAIIARIQNELFDLGADLSTPERTGALRVTAGQVAALEADIDALNAPLSPLTSFVLPGGSPAAAHLHLARTVCRRAERTCVALAAVETVEAESLKYLNRLSDLLFVAARAANSNGAGDVLWVPGATR